MEIIEDWYYNIFESKISDKERSNRLAMNRLIKAHSKEINIAIRKHRAYLNGFEVDVSFTEEEIYRIGILLRHTDNPKILNKLRGALNLAKKKNKWLYQRVGVHR